jgi:hypothetical protein
MSILMANKRVRLVMTVDEELRDALRLEAARRRKDMSEVLAELMTEGLAEALAEIRQSNEADSKKPKGKGSKPAPDDA